MRRPTQAWVYILIGLFIACGLWIASVGTPWYGEDEPSHFGYIEALARENKWYSFEDNKASIDMRLAQKRWNLSNGDLGLNSQMSDLKFYRDYASGHTNATAYQPPFYYWIISRLYRGLDGLDIVSILYIFRYINVVLGGLYVYVVYLISRELFKEDLEQILMTSFVGFLPLLKLLASTVTVQMSVFLLYGLMILFLFKGKANGRYYYLAVAVAGMGLLTQQAFLAAPILIVSMLIWDVWHKHIDLRKAGLLMGLLVVVLVMVTPQWLKRHAETQYTTNEGGNKVRRTLPATYLPSQWERIREEVIYYMWDQNRSLVPYYSSEKVKRGAVLLFTVSMVGLGYGGWQVWVNKKDLKRWRRWFFLSAVTGGVFVAGHLWFDYRQMIYSGQEYLKARYFFPILPLVAWAYTFGWRSLSRKKDWWRLLVLWSVLVFIFMQLSAVSWLMLKIAKN